MSVDRDAFRANFVRAVSTGIAFFATAALLALLVVGAKPADFVYGAIVVVGSAISAYLAQNGRSVWALYLLSFCLIGAAAGYVIGAEFRAFVLPGSQVPVLVVMVFTLMAPKESTARAFAVLAILSAFFPHAVLAMRTDNPRDGLLGGAFSAVVVLISAAASGVIRRFIDHRNAEVANRMADIGRLVEQAKRITRGDLTGRVEGEDELAEVMREMSTSLRDVVEQVQKSASVLGSSASQIAAMSVQQGRGAVHQASAVSETRETIQSLATSARKIAESARGVLANAESTLKNNEIAGERINALTGHTRRINELLEFIKDVSNKSELLALNAALEGTKAGEAGRGFSLVAARMQRLAESTMATVKDVKGLITDITSATNATVLSMEDATKLAADTTRAAREISLITQQQGSSVEQVVEAMADIATVTGEFAGGSEDTQAATEELRKVSEALAETINRFHV